MPTPRPSEPPRPDGERAWRQVMFYLSAVMGALALVDFDAGRIAHGLGDAGVACLLISIEAQFPLLRALARSEGGAASAEDVIKRLEQERVANPWPHRIGRAGWAFLATSLLLRLAGVA